MRILIRALLIAVIALPLTAGTPQLPRELARAKYVALGFETAGGFVSEYDFKHLASIPEDRRALERVRAALEGWGKYHVTTPEAAELLISLRAGRLASASGGGGVSAGTDRNPAGTVLVGGDIGPRADLLAVYSADHISGEQTDPAKEGAGRNTTPLGLGRTRPGSLLWRASALQGLQGDPPLLVDRLKSDVASIPEKKKK